MSFSSFETHLSLSLSLYIYLSLYTKIYSGPAVSTLLPFYFLHFFTCLSCLSVFLHKLVLGPVLIF